MLVILGFGLLLIYGGFSVYADQTSGIPGEAKVIECEGGGKYRPGVHCRGSWTVGGSLGRGGRLVIGDVEGAGYGDVGDTLSVRIHDGGDRAVKPGLGTPIMLWVLGAPVVLFALFGLRSWWRDG